MENKALFREMNELYTKNSFAHNYVLGYTINGNVYACFCDERILPYVMSLSKASRGAGYALRFRPTRAQKEIFRTENNELICSVDEFNSLVAESRYNKGEIFEKLIVEKFADCPIWTKDSVPFTRGGDMDMNGVSYQIKFEGATFASERTLANLCK